MKAFLTLAILAALGLAAEAYLECVKPRDVLPAIPKYMARAWQEKYVAQKQTPEYYPHFQKSTEAKAESAGKVQVPLDNQHQRITNGSTASRGQFPWQVAIIIDDVNFCGGSLISSRWVLTAAHCTGNSYLILLGSNRIDTPNNGSRVVQANTTIKYPQYNAATINHDIALIYLSSEITNTTYIRPIRLRKIPCNLAVISARASGWGRISDSSSGISPTLQYADLPVITNAACASVYGSIINLCKLCTNSSIGQSICHGDSGGPLSYLESDGIYTQIGIASFVSANGCQSGNPAGFTRVNCYLSWIAAVTGIPFDCA